MSKRLHNLPVTRRVPPCIPRVRLLPLALMLAGLFAAAPTLSAAGQAPSLMLAKVYQPGALLPDYWVSEKYDGVRGYWDGKELLTRGGEHIAAPAWFTAGWPQTPMEGELWAGRGQFAKAVSTVRQQTPTEDVWRGMRFMVFDLPGETGTFTQRLTVLNSQVGQINQAWVQAVAQIKVANHQALQGMMAATVQQGGEGLMLHRGASFYKAQRNDDLLKFKPFEDAEARVVAHVPGKGKYAGKTGALLVEMPAMDGGPARRFKLGTGLSDAQRDNPPPVGTVVTYRFRGVNDGGTPRFASFMRVREDQL